VSGRPSARLVPARQNRWHRWDDVTDLFAGPADADWEADRELVEDAVRDPWAEQ
jgi:antitoxin (DNA-binding transcriptional repressor) of toxin-antitoxin stability system